MGRRGRCPFLCRYLSLQGEERNTNKLSRRERNCACGRLLARILTERASSRSSPSARSCLPHRSNRRENDLQVTVSPVLSLSRVGRMRQHFLKNSLRRLEKPSIGSKVAGLERELIDENGLLMNRTQRAERVNPILKELMKA
ncbi:hypothetical protein Tco_1182634 [Tanacetum coccineum]